MVACCKRLCHSIQRCNISLPRVLCPRQVEQVGQLKALVHSMITLAQTQVETLESTLAALDEMWVALF